MCSVERMDPIPRDARWKANVDVICTCEPVRRLARTFVPTAEHVRLFEREWCAIAGVPPDSFERLDGGVLEIEDGARLAESCDVMRRCLNAVLVGDLRPEWATNLRGAFHGWVVSARA